MCKTHFDSQGMILNDFNFFFFFEKNVMANAIKNFHTFLDPSLLVAALIGLPNFGNKGSVSIFHILPIRLYAAIRR